MPIRNCGGRDTFSLSFLAKLFKHGGLPEEVCGERLGGGPAPAVAGWTQEQAGRPAHNDSRNVRTQTPMET